jgi:hypothetical protein
MKTILSIIALLVVLLLLWKVAATIESDDHNPPKWL